MNKKEIRQSLLAKGYPSEVIQKGLAKAERWMKKAYGGVDYQEYCNEVGNPIEAVENYCQETMMKPTGQKTFNRGFS
jgi:hypothetical protein